MSKNGMAGGLSYRNGRTSLGHLPDAKQLYTIDFSRLDGGLNIYDLDYRLNPNESPDMKNLRWKDGALGSRNGQEWVVCDWTQEDPEEHPVKLGTGYAAYDDLFWDYAFVHAGTKLYCFRPGDAQPVFTELKSGVPNNRGTFFRYKDYLMYKNRGGYYRIEYDPSGATVAAKFPVKTLGDFGIEFVPVTYINMNPETAAGAAYQPQNRLSRKKTVWYTAVGNVTDYLLPIGNGVTVAGISAEITNMQTPPTVTAYHDTAADKWYARFSSAPTVPVPDEPNTVRVTYETSSAADTDAYNAVMDCPYAVVYGGDQSLCVVVGGCAAQPNAYFWNGNDQYGMNPFYFPMEQYNFAGDTESAVMGFGKQQGFLVVFSKKGVGKATFGTTTTDSDRIAIEMPYTAINSRIGCDFPWSIQLVDNNLVFCNQEHGVCLLLDSSAAYENNITELSKKVNGNEARHGMMYDTYVMGADGVFSTIFEDKYWLVTNEHAYVWDFRLSDYGSPTWFFYTNIKGVAFIHHVDDLYHLSADGGASTFRRDHFADYGAAIEKVYQFATQMMGTYDRLKNAVSVLFAIRSDTDTITQVWYLTDYETRRDLTPLMSFQWKLSPRHLTYRFLGITRFASVHRRMPMCRHIRHFAMRLENSEPYQDLSVISAQVQFNYQGRQK